MSHRASSWSYRLNLSPTDKLHARTFISEELRYFNSMVTGMAGPLRTMGSTFASMTGSMEELFGEVAAYRIDVRSFKADSLPSNLTRFAHLLFKDGKSIIDSRTLLLFDIACSEGALHTSVRRAMAIEMLRYAREQTLAFTSVQEGDQAYKYAMQMLSPLELSSKRHLQIPRSAASVVVDEGEMSVRFPYTSETFKMPKPPIDWNLAILRDDGNEQWTLELLKEKSLYALRRTDSSRYDKRKSNGKFGKKPAVRGVR